MMHPFLITIDVAIQIIIVFTLMSNDHSYAFSLAIFMSGVSACGSH